MTEPTKLMSAEEFAHMENPSYDKAVATYAAALTALHEAEHAREAATRRVAELEAEKQKNLEIIESALLLEEFAAGHPGMCCGQCSRQIGEAERERDALAVELAELRVAVLRWKSAPSPWAEP